MRVSDIVCRGADASALRRDTANRDPGRRLARNPDGIARRLVLDTLTTVSDTGGAQPALAVRWQSQNAAHRWEFWIRAGVHFQDGEPLTSDAVVAALTEVCSRAGAGTCPWRTVRGVGASVVFTSDSPVPDLPELLAQSQFAIARQDAKGAVVGTGPFRVNRLHERGAHTGGERRLLVGPPLCRALWKCGHVGRCGISGWT